MLFSGFHTNSIAECLFTQYNQELDFHALRVKWHLQLTIPISYAQCDAKFLVNVL